MANPFGTRNDLNFLHMGMPSDWVPVTPNNTTDNLGTAPETLPVGAGEKNIGIAIKATGAGDVSWLTPWGDTRTQTFLAGEVLPAAVRRVFAASTTATGIHVAVVY